MKLLRKIVRASLSKTTGIVELSVVTRWPSVSVSIANSLLIRVSEFNLHTRQGQAIVERFVHEICGCDRLWRAAGS